MPAIIGGSPSTGTSVLVNVVNRHSKIYAGPETHLFTKPNLYLDWNRYKRSILNRRKGGLKSPGLHRFNGVILDESKNLKSLVDDANSLMEFADKYFDTKEGDWIEKTPANSYCFDHFLNTNDSSKVILMVRNPYDTVSSLMARGLSLPAACAIYLCNSLANFDLSDDERFHIIQYESLVHESEKEVKELCEFLEIEYEPQLLQGEEELIKMKGWKQNEKDSIGVQSLNRFSELEDPKKEEIINALASIKLVSKQWPFDSIEIKSILDICDLLGYEFIDPSTTDSKKTTTSLWKEKLNSTIRLYPNNIFNYPIIFE